jgi:hypothetical protein
MFRLSTQKTFESSQWLNCLFSFSSNKERENKQHRRNSGIVGRGVKWALVYIPTYIIYVHLDGRGNSACGWFSWNENALLPRRTMKEGGGGKKELREGGTWGTNSQKKYVKLLLFLFLPFFLKIQIHQSIGRLSNHRPNTESCGVCVWREQLLPSLRLNHISLILYLQTQFARRLVLTRIIKEPASRIAELSDQINKNERREEILKKKTRPLDMEDSSHLPALLIWQILYEPEIPGHTPK